MNDLKSRIIKKMVSSCSCLTKTPISEYHDEDCLYRVLGDCLNLIENPRNMVIHVLGNDLVEKLVKDQYNAINDLDDPWVQHNEHSCLVSVSSVNLAVQVMDSICQPLKEDFIDLHNSITRELDKLNNNDASELDMLMTVAKNTKDKWKLSNT